MILTQSKFVSGPLLSRQPVKRMKHRSDVGRSGCSENESCSTVLYSGVQKEDTQDSPPKMSYNNLVLKKQTHTTVVVFFVCVCVCVTFSDRQWRIALIRRSSRQQIRQTEEICCWKERVGSRQTPRLPTVLANLMSEPSRFMDCGTVRVENRLCSNKNHFRFMICS